MTSLRETQMASILEALMAPTTRVVVVCGASGSGKTYALSRLVEKKLVTSYHSSVQSYARHSKKSGDFSVGASALTKKSGLSLGASSGGAVALTKKKTVVGHKRKRETEEEHKQQGVYPPTVVAIDHVASTNKAMEKLLASLLNVHTTTIKWIVVTSSVFTPDEKSKDQVHVVVFPPYTSTEVFGYVMASSAHLQKHFGLTSCATKEEALKARRQHELFMRRLSNIAQGNFMALKQALSLIPCYRMLTHKYLKGDDFGPFCHRMTHWKPDIHVESSDDDSEDDKKDKTHDPLLHLKATQLHVLVICLYKAFSSFVTTKATKTSGFELSLDELYTEIHTNQTWCAINRAHGELDKILKGLAPFVKHAKKEKSISILRPYDLWRRLDHLRELELVSSVPLLTRVSTLARQSFR